MMAGVVIVLVHYDSKQGVDETVKTQNKILNSFFSIILNVDNDFE